MENIFSDMLVSINSALLEDDSWVVDQMQWVSLMVETQDSWEETIANASTVNAVDLIEAKMYVEEKERRQAYRFNGHIASMRLVYSLLHSKAAQRRIDIAFADER